MRAPSPPSGPSPASSNRGPNRLLVFVIALVAVVAVAAVLTVVVVSFEISANFGCGSGRVYQGHQVCIQDVLTAASAFSTEVPTMAASCPSVVALNASFHCWFNLTSTASTPQNLTSISAGDSSDPFALLSVSNPLPLTLAPGQVAVEELTIRAPAAAGAYNLLLVAQVVASG